MGRQESASARIPAPPESVYRLVTDPNQLPTWNRAIAEVIEAPSHLEAGSVWKVKIHAMGSSWVSRSKVSNLDTASGRFAYRSQTDDGNPSYADWKWQVVPDQDGCIVTVSVDINPITFWRKHLLASIRRPALRKEMQDSLSALGAAVQP